MSPSSLIFVAVIAVWAAYLVIDTSRRREYLATASTVERFSDSMRVLQRRAVRRETAEAFEASTAPMRRTSSVRLHPGPQVVARAAADARAAQGPLPAASRGGAAALAARQQAAARLRTARRMALGALVSGAIALITAAVAGFGLISWLVPVAALLAGVGLAFGVRRSALQARSLRRGAAPQARSASARVVRRSAGTAAAITAPAAVADEVADDLRPAATAMPVAQEFVPTPFDHTVFEPATVAEADVLEPQADPLFGEEGWQPVPVPPPTYTLKARAERPVPPPIEVEQPEMQPVEDWDDMDQYYYRAVGE